MATISLPVELWQIILRYAISVPVFLDANVLESLPSLEVFNKPQYLWNDQRPYWATERHLTNLRRVCHSWNKYLSQFRHRFVRMRDIWHQTVPLSVLRRAVRVHLDIKGCSCQDICNQLAVRHDVSTIRRFGEPPIFYLKLFEELGRVPWEIVTVEKMDAKMKIFLKNVQRFPRIKALVLNNGASGKVLGAVANRFYTLQHLHGRGYWGAQEIESFHSANIVSLSFCPQGDLAENVAAQIYLPSLRHLHVDGRLQRVLSMIRRVGSTLKSLSWDQSRYEVIPQEIWDICPNLERLNIDCQSSSSPPPDHPINTLVTTLFDLPLGGANLKSIQIWFPAWTNVSRMILRSTLWENFDRDLLPSQLEWMRLCRENKIRLEDMNGHTLEDYTRTSDIWFDEQGRVRAIKYEFLERTELILLQRNVPLDGTFLQRIFSE